MLSMQERMKIIKLRREDMPKTKQLHMRLSENEIEMLNQIKREIDKNSYNCTITEVIRIAIKSLYNIMVVR